MDFAGFFIYVFSQFAVQVLAEMRGERIKNLKPHPTDLEAYIKSQPPTTSNRKSVTKNVQSTAKIEPSDITKGLKYYILSIFLLTHLSDTVTKKLVIVPTVAIHNVTIISSRTNMSTKTEI